MSVLTAGFGAHLIEFSAKKAAPPTTSPQLEIMDPTMEICMYEFVYEQSKLNDITEL